MVSSRLIKTAMVVIVVILLLSLFRGLGWLRPAENLLTSFFSPVGSFLHGTGLWVGGLIKHDEEFDIVLNEKNQLKEERDSLLSEVARLKEMERENEVLRTYLSFVRSSGLEYRLAGVVAQGNAGDNWRNRESITINRGTRDGLSAGLPVLSSEGVLLGKIIEAEDNLSRACLLVSPSCRLAVTVSGLNETLGIAQGDLGLTVQIDLIPQNKSLNEGDIIVTSGLEQDMPAGLVVGKIDRVIKQQNELWQKAIVTPAADFDNLRVVMVAL